MPNKNNRASPYLSTYHRKKSLLILFILHEWVKLNKAIQKARLLKNKTAYLHKLIQFSHPYLTLSPWNHPVGPLAKLEVFLQSLNADNLLKKLSKVSQAIFDKDSKALFYLENFSNELNLFIPSIISSFKHDENILYFIVKEKQTIDRFIKEGYTKKLLKDLYPKKTTSFYKDFLKKFNDRNFENLSSFIEKKITSIGI